MTNSDQNQLVADLAHEFVAKTAPQEMPLFRALSEAYFKNPDKALTKKGGTDEMLGFGAGEAMTFLTPVVLSIITEVVKFVTSEVEKSVKAEGSSLISDSVKAMFKKFRPVEQKEEKKVPPSLTPEQIVRVRKLAFDKARQLNLSEDKAGLLADSVVGGLVTTS